MYRITNLSDRDIHFITFLLEKGKTEIIEDYDESCNHSLITNNVRMSLITISKVAEPKIIREPIVKEKVRKTRNTKKGT